MHHVDEYKGLPPGFKFVRVGERPRGATSGGSMTRYLLAVPLLVLVSFAVAHADTPSSETLAAGQPEFALDAVTQTAHAEGLRLGLARADLTSAGTAGALTRDASVPSNAASADAQPTLQPRARAFEYSDGYRVRLKIHKYASFATLPVFVAQYVVGQKLYNGTGSNNTRTLHSALAGTTGVLFGANTVTGIWNLSEGHKDPNGRTKKMLHGMLMMAADGGFVATAVMAPHLHRRNGTVGGVSPATHRGIALTSMGVATVGYLMMLFHH
jgi:hypothetical protein